MPYRVTAAVVAVVAVGSLTACGSSGGGNVATSPEPGTSISGSPAADLPPSKPGSSVNTSPAGPSTGAAAPSAPVTVNKSVTDPAFGNAVTVLKYVAGYQPSAAAEHQYSSLADEKVILVDVKVTAGRKYFGSFGSGDFRLVAGGGAVDVTTTSILDGELTKAGYPPLKDADTGKSSTGWLVFLPQNTLTDIVLRVVRLAYKTSDGKTLPAKNFDLSLGRS